MGHHADGTAAGLVAAIDAMTEAGQACLSTALLHVVPGRAGLVTSPRATKPVRAAILPRSLRRGARRHRLSNPMKAFSGIEPLALQGERAGDGYRVRGRLPWVSNLGPASISPASLSLQTGGG